MIFQAPPSLLSAAYLYNSLVHWKMLMCLWVGDFLHHSIPRREHATPQQQAEGSMQKN